MSVSMDASDGLLRHVLVSGFVTNSPIRDHDNDSKHSNNRVHPTSFVHSTPTNFIPLSSTPPVFALPTFSPLKRNQKSTPLNSSPSDAAAKISPTTWVLPKKYSSPSLSSSRFLSQHRVAMSPILNLAKIDETKVFETPVHAETSEHAINMNQAIPETLITSATPDGKDVVGANQSFECHSVKQFHAGSDLDNISFRLKNTSFSPVLDRSGGFIISPGDGIHKRYLKFRRSHITFGNIIGKGAFGCVYTGSIAGNPVAVKIVQKRRGSGIHREILQAERLAFTLNLRHENIVEIYGVNLCEELRGDALILMELVSSNSLQKLIDDTSIAIKIRERLNYAVQVAKGLSYLHGQFVAHLDVKPANVLMTLDHVCKLSDFGNLTQTRSEVRKEEPEFTQLLGTLPYRAPELMTGLFPSTKADIYSFGITLWQMLTRESPHKNANPHALIYQVVKSNIRPSIPDTGNDVTEILYRDLYTSCWSREVDMRPDANEIIVNIRNNMQNLEN